MATTPTTIIVNTPPLPKSVVIDALTDHARGFQQDNIRLREYADILEGQVYELTRERADLIQDIGRMEELLLEAHAQ